MEENSEGGERQRREHLCVLMCVSVCPCGCAVEVVVSGVCEVVGLSCLFLVWK